MKNQFHVWIPNSVKVTMSLFPSVVSLLPCGLWLTQLPGFPAWAWVESRCKACHLGRAFEGLFI